MAGQAIMEGDGGLLFTGDIQSRVLPGTSGGGAPAPYVTVTVTDAPTNGKMLIAAAEDPENPMGIILQQTTAPADVTLDESSAVSSGSVVIDISLDPDVPNKIIKHMGSPPVIRKPFELTIAGSTLSVSDCYFMRGPLFVEADPPPSASFSGTSMWLCVEITLEDNSLTLVDTPMTELPETSGVYVVPLYRLTWSSSAGKWEISLDARPGMVIVYV